MDGVQIGILAFAGIIILLFIKYKITGSVRAEFRFIGLLLNRACDVLGVMAVLGAIMSLACAVVILASGLMPPARTVTRTVAGKQNNYQWAAERHVPVLSFAGDDKPARGVSYRLYSLVQVGDELEIALSWYFSDAQKVSVRRGGRIVATTDEMQSLSMVLVAMICLVPLTAFRAFFRRNRNRAFSGVIFIVLILLELIPLGILLQGAR